MLLFRWRLRRRRRGRAHHAERDLGGWAGESWRPQRVWSAEDIDGNDGEGSNAMASRLARKSMRTDSFDFIANSRDSIRTSLDDG
jgi:hypothetical protein